MRKLISRLSANKALFNIAKCIFPDKIELLQKQIISHTYICQISILMNICKHHMYMTV